MDKDLERESEPIDGRGIVNCPGCGSKNIKISPKEHHFPYGIGGDKVELSAEVPVKTCVDCGFSFRDIIAENLCHEVVCRHLGVMTPSQIKNLRKLHGLTQAQFSEITKLGEATLSRWERGVVIQNQAYDNYLYLLAFKENLQLIRERGELPEPMKQVVGEAERSQFRELDVNDEDLLAKKNNFKLITV